MRLWSINIHDFTCPVTEMIPVPSAVSLL